MAKSRKISIKMLVLAVICGVLTLALIFSVLHILKQNEEIGNAKTALANVQSANSQLTTEKNSYESQITEKDNTISSLESQITEKDNTISSLESQVEYFEKLKADKLNPTVKPEVDPNASAKKALLEDEAKKLANQKAAAKGQKLCFLTFDDGPCANTGKVLKVLKEKDAKATFFVTNQFSKYRYYLKQIDAEGHAIGIHTTTHRYDEIYKSETAFFNDLNTMGNIIKDEVGYFPKITRFPGGSSNSYSITQQLVYSVYEKGYQYFDWNVSSGDATVNKVPKTIAANVIDGAKGKDSICVLMHDIHKETAEALPTIIDGLREQGFVFMPLTEDNYGYHHRPY